MQPPARLTVIPHSPLPPTARFPPPPSSAAETTKVRDACVIEKGEAFCKTEIEAHKACLRLEGFDVA